MTRARTAFLAVAVAIVFGGLLLTPVPPAWWRVALAVAVAALAQQLVVRLRVGPAVFSLAWGEAALVIALVLLPGGWVAASVAIGTVLGIVLRHRRYREAVTLPVAVRAGASLGLAAAFATALAGVLGSLWGAGPAGTTTVTPGTAAVLGCAAAAYLIATSLLAAVGNAVRFRMSLARLLARVVPAKALMFVGNATIGLTVVGLASSHRWALIGLVPVIWLLHRSYAHRLRVSEHRRMWGAFARATRSLNRADEEEVAVAGVHGAVEVFAVGTVEVALRTGDGVVRTWTGDQSGEVRQSFQVEPTSSRQVEPVPAARSGSAPTAVPLLVGAEQVGQLRVHFPALAGPGEGEQAALHAYGDALAAAVHDAATHQRLHRVLARAASDAQRDPLTRLYSRAALLNRGETAVQLAPDAAQVTLLLVDVDHFREINDTLGHAAGDETLRVTAQRLRRQARPGELLARLGGDEFALLAIEAPGRPEPPDHTGAAALLRGQELARQLAEEAEISGVPVSIDVSVGVVVAAAGTVDLTELLRRGGVGMRQARQGRSGRAGRYDVARDPGSSDRPALLADLRTALDRDDELALVLQPVVDLATGAPIELEALVRWQHPQRGLLPASEFVRAVEHSDLLERFTEYVVDRALAAAAAQARRGPAIPVAVNLSARSLLDPRLPEAVQALLRRHRVPGRRLVLEITETVVASELPGIDAALARLRGLGVRLAVDDFGTGPASLSFLTRVPLDEVKIDAGLVAAVGTSAPAEAIVRTTAELGRELGLRVVAEGVETPEQRAAMAALGCTAAQGYAIAPPVPADLIGPALADLALTPALPRI